MRATSNSSSSRLWTIVATVASAQYIPAAIELGVAARAVGFGCVAIMPMDNATASLAHEAVRPVETSAAEIRPRDGWCTAGQRSSYGWRRAQIYRARLWRLVLELGYSLLYMDADWRIKTNPVPRLMVLRTKTYYGLVNGSDTLATFRRLNPAVDVDATTGHEARVVPFLHDGSWGTRGNPAYLNVGLLWWRGQADGGDVDAYALALRVENRTYGGWEQAVFNEELGWGSSASCCFATRLSRQVYFVQSAKDTVLNRNASAREQSDGKDVCLEPADYPTALSSPPHVTRMRWSNAAVSNQTLRWHALSRTGSWHKREYNLPIETRVHRCSLEDNVCPLLSHPQV